MTKLDLSSQNTCGPLRAGRRSALLSGLLRLYAHAPALSLHHSLSLALSVSANWLESSEFSLLPSISLSLSPSTWFDLPSSKEFHATRVYFQQMWLTGLFLHETGHPTPLTAEVSINLLDTLTLKNNVGQWVKSCARFPLVSNRKCLPEQLLFIACTGGRTSPLCEGRGLGSPPLQRAKFSERREALIND